MHSLQNNPPVSRQLPRLSVAMFLLMGIGPALAMGGHFAIDDAGLLDPDQCQVEIWAERHSSPRRVQFHVGPACRVGAFEVGLNLDRSHIGGSPDVQSFAPQIKWAHALNDSWAVGAVVSAAWERTESGAFAGGTLAIPVSWQFSEAASLHVSVGRDFRHRAPDASRAGVALEWAVSPALSAIAERYRENGLGYARFGVRWNALSGLIVDVSRANGLGSAQPHWWTLGASWLFER